ncbi:MAG: aminotransferase class III-fold pyridoxal phosphate-dependent enzyme [Rhodopseudomonas palustris]|uniref:Aminotransferase class III-fold pyridoxal phosphate-dependent enzyme n=1 Tax=Rhodopseudomonas palustris TaxID=1076 RepID=A0A933S4F8_RHOPL|nr:aminotransferase class III-fold pyridoxal phosphate-dependent enzyme [Rhodopseudomonas palustris]
MNESQTCSPLLPKAGVSSLLKPDLSADYATIISGEGPYLFDSNGRRYLDGSSGAMVANLGHGRRDVAAVMADQAATIAFTFRNQFSNEPAERLANKLCGLAPDGITRAFFVNSGSEASEYAIRLALHYWKERKQPGKTKVLGRSTSYHGMTMGALSISGHAGRRPDYGPLLHRFANVPPAYCYRCPFDLQPERCALECAEAWESEIIAQDPGTVAAVIAEPIVGAAGGVLPAPPGYFRKLREICDRHDILLIADEVITGAGRTGAWFASEQEGIVPDLILLAKGLSAGYTPMAAILLRDRVVDAFIQGSGVVPFGHTFSANPLSAAVCLFVLDYIERNDLLRNARERGAELQQGLQALSQRHRSMVDVRGRGLLWGFELVADRASRKPFDAKFNAAARLVAICRQRGLVIYPAGIAPYNNSFIVSPPLTVSSDHVEELLQILADSLDEFDATIPTEPSTISH